MVMLKLFTGRSRAGKMIQVIAVRQLYQNTPGFDMLVDMSNKLRRPRTTSV